MTLEEIAAAFADLADKERLAAALRLPVELCPEEVTRAFPSLELQSDGPVLSRLLLVTKNFLCEVQLDWDENSWDYARLDSIRNYRIKIWDHVIKSAHEDSQEQTEQRFRLGNVTLVHDFGERTATQLTYVGDEPERWVREVVAAIPISALRG